MSSSLQLSPNGIWLSDEPAGPWIVASGYKEWLQGFVRAGILTRSRLTLSVSLMKRELRDRLR